MSFNLKKQSQKSKESVLPIYKGIEENASKYNLSLEKKDIVSMNGMLEADRRPIESATTHEAMLDESRKKAAKNERIIEGELEKADSPLFPHRQFEEGTKSHVTSQAMLAEAFDRKYRDAFSKANKDSNTEFWDKYVGVDIEGDKTTISSQVPSKSNQLGNVPDRFGNLDGLPHNADPVKNRENLGKALKVKPMQGFKGNEKPLTMAMSSLNNADKILYNTYLQVSKENRSLNDSELELVNGINKNKMQILMALAQSLPPSEPNPPLPTDPINNQSNPLDNQTDFLDGNPTVQDEGLMAQQSGADLSSHSPLDTPVNNDLFDGIDENTGEPIPQMGNPIPPEPGTTGLNDGSDLGFDDGQQPPMDLNNPQSNPQVSPETDTYFNLDQEGNNGQQPSF